MAEMLVSRPDAPSAIVVADPGDIALGTLRRVYLQTPASIAVEEAVWGGVERSNAAVKSIVSSGRPVYGVNTGFGNLAQARISSERLAELQHNLILSHCAGLGPYLDENVTRLIVFLKALSLLQGHSGVRPEVIRTLLAFIHEGVAPCIPSQGSVGASGDLAPLAHLAAALVGAGEVRYRGEILPAGDALRAIGREPLALAPKEGLALVNGTQVSSALAIAGLIEAEHLFAAAVVAGALSVDGLKGSVVPFDDRIHRLRRQRGQREIAAVYRSLLKGSSIVLDHVDCGKVQDPYSLRCQPQVMGACLDSLRHAADTLEREANAVTDNPLVFSEEAEILSGGNFHAEPVGFAADALAIAIAEIGAISERRIALLLDPNMNGDLPPFLIENSGLNSGFMIAQVSAAALASENKSLAHPASVDSIPTSANQEDHVSMATFAARRLRSMTSNSMGIVAVELLAACQAIDFLAPLKTSEILQNVFAGIRSRVPKYDADRMVSPDVAVLAEGIRAGDFYPLVDSVLPSAHGHVKAR